MTPLSRLTTNYAWCKIYRLSLKDVFLKLKYPQHLFNFAVKQFLDPKVSSQQNISSSREKMNTVRVILPFKDQASANVVKQRLNNLSAKINNVIQPVFISRKLNEDIRVQEVKPDIVNQQCVVYQFKCNLCDAGYVGYTRGHLHERVDGHKHKSSSIYKHYLSKHNATMPACFLEQFRVLAKCNTKFDCLVKEMLFIRKLQPTLNVQTDSIVRLDFFLLFKFFCSYANFSNLTDIFYTTHNL